MSSTRSLLLGAATGGALVLLGGLAGAQQRPGLVKGGGSAGVEKEATFRFNTVEGRATQSDCDRNVLKVPPAYGNAFAVTVGPGKQPVVWFRNDTDGSVRNVILQDDQMLVRLIPGA